MFSFRHKVLRYLNKNTDVWRPTLALTHSYLPHIKCNSLHFPSAVVHRARKVRVRWWLDWPYTEIYFQRLELRPTSWRKLTYISEVTECSYFYPKYDPCPLSLKVFLKRHLIKTIPCLRMPTQLKVSSGSDAEAYKFPQFCLQFRASATADISTGQNMWYDSNDLNGNIKCQGSALLMLISANTSHPPRNCPVHYKFSHHSWTSGRARSFLCSPVCSQPLNIEQAQM